MKSTALVLLTIGLAIGLTACFQHTYDVGTGAPDGDIVYRHWHHHWLFGLIRPKLQKQVDVDQFCPSGNATIHEEVSFTNGLIDVLIGIIYSPTTVEIRCDDGSTATVELEAKDVARIVRDPRFPDLVREVAPDRLAATLGALEGGLEPRSGDRIMVAP